MMYTEEFVYIGYFDGLHVFQRRVTTDRDDAHLLEETCQVYNAMMHNEMIADGDNVLIYNLCGENRIFPTVCCHISFKPRGFRAGQTELIYKSCCAMERTAGSLPVITAHLRAISPATITDHSADVLQRLDIAFIDAREIARTFAAMRGAVLDAKLVIDDPAYVQTRKKMPGSIG